MELVVSLLTILLVSLKCSTEKIDKDYWYKKSTDDLNDALAKQKLNMNIAKNVVLIIGDGMGVSTTTAGRIYRGQQTPGMIGEEMELSWDKFPHVGLSKTYTTDTMTADSAGSATAFHCGVKTKNGAIGVDDNILVGNCSTTDNARVQSIADWALEEGKSVGIVTTDSLFGASPSPLFAHAALRDWKDDSRMPEAARGVCKDIALQLIENEPGINIQVLLGGGRASMLGENTTDPEYPDKKGLRKDGRNLMEEWEQKQNSMGQKASVVYDRNGFEQIDVDTTEYLLGVFDQERMLENSLRKINNTEPSIAELTEMAINILKKNPKGFYLFIEGANIDLGHHENRAHYALEETLTLDDAVTKVMDMTSTDDTLVIVSADHSHEFAFGGYSSRGENILGLVDNHHEPHKRNHDKLNNTFTIIAYGNGPGYYTQRQNLTKDMFANDHIEVKLSVNKREVLYVSPIPLDYETHAGEDVAIFASGPMAHLFSGVHEQTFIAHGMSYAACIGRNKDHCANNTGSSAKVTSGVVFIVFLSILIL